MADPEHTTSLLDHVPVEVTIQVGRARPMVRDLLQLRQDSILPLDRRIDDPVELYVGEKLIARGILQDLGETQPGYLGVRLTEMVDPKGPF
jgi:flagellar motor switch protein FliN/FliY